MSREDYSIILNLGETGRLKADVVGKHIDRVYDIRIYVACNDIHGIPGEVLSRFWLFRIARYTNDEFKEVCRRILVERERKQEDIAQYIAENLASVDVRDAVRIARMSNSVEDATDLLSIFRKWS